MFRTIPVAFPAVMFLCGCMAIDSMPTPANPGADGQLSDSCLTVSYGSSPALDGLPTPSDYASSAVSVPINGKETELEGPLVSLGTLEADTAISFLVQSECARSVLLADATGDVLDGGQVGVPLSFPLTATGDYFLLLDSDDRSNCSGTIAIEQHAVLTETTQPQVFLLNFDGTDNAQLSCENPPCTLDAMDLSLLVDRDYEDDPDLNLWTQISPDHAEEFLGEIQPLVIQMVTERLAAMFEPYGMTIVLGLDGAEEPEGPYSVVHFTSTTAPPVCDQEFDGVPVMTSNGVEVVLYGQAGELPDFGNRLRDDEAVVYVDSFGGSNLFLLTTDVASLVNALANAAAHEMGHLLGLQHTFRNDDVMYSGHAELGGVTNTLILELDFVRSQLVLGSRCGESSRPIPFLYQNPEKYLERLSAP